MIYRIMKSFIGAILAIAIASCAQSQSEKTDIQKLDALDFKTTLETMRDIQLIDVRTREEFASGHLQGSVNYDIYLNDFDSQLASLNKAQPVMVYCKGGGRSAEACEKLEKMGFFRIYDMSGGIMAWEAKGFPTEGMQGSIAMPDKYTMEDFNKIISSSTPVMIDFYAPWCAPCKKMEPLLAQLSKEFDSRIKIERINVDDAKNLCKQLKVESLPVITTYKSGQELTRLSGFQDEAKLRALIESMLK